MRQERSKFMSEIQELKNHNAGLIEDHTRDVLSIKAKETQLVRARSDAEATDQTNERLRRELDRLKKALSRAEASVGISSPGKTRFPNLIFEKLLLFTGLRYIHMTDLMNRCHLPRSRRCRHIPRLQLLLG